MGFGMESETERVDRRQDKGFQHTDGTCLTRGCPNAMLGLMLPMWSSKEDGSRSHGSKEECGFLGIKVGAFFLSTV